MFKSCKTLVALNYVAIGVGIIQQQIVIKDRESKVNNIRISHSNMGI
jgi:hypothetical protein